MNFGEREGKAKAKHRGRVVEKVYYVFFFFNNILLAWKIVGASKASVLYVYIDNIKKKREGHSTLQSNNSSIHERN